MSLLPAPHVFRGAGLPRVLRLDCRVSIACSRSALRVLLRQLRPPWERRRASPPEGFPGFKEEACVIREMTGCTRGDKCRPKLLHTLQIAAFESPNRDRLILMCTFAFARASASFFLLGCRSHNVIMSRRMLFASERVRSLPCNPCFAK